MSNKSEKQMAQAAGRFAARWEGRGYEKGESQLFWTELLTEVFGVSEPSTFITFEDQVKLDHTSFIDGYIARTHTLIEQKSLDKDLRAPIKQSDGTWLTPFRQAQRYSAALPYSRRPRWIVACNFSTFLVHDMENPDGEPFEIRLADLGKEWHRLRFLVDEGADHLARETRVSMQAGVIVGRLYDALLKEYRDPTNPASLRSLNVLCVRLVFCLYAEDAGIFGRRDMFHDYLDRYATIDMRHALVRLFQTLDTPLAERDPYLQDDLAAFPYANGGLFSDDIEIPRMNEEIRDLLLRHASLDFDWSEISPTIFGAVFESTLNPDTRRGGGMHYTSIENIHKVIDPLFLDGLRAELDRILAEPVANRRRRALLDYQERLSSLTFLDPACGSGNFLTETYLSLRRLENRLIRSLYEGEAMFIGSGFQNPVRVSIHQFHGIEVNDFAVTVATTALWISEAQMLAETERIVARDIDFLPLKTYPNIVEGNALRMDWRGLFHVGESRDESFVGELCELNGFPPENQTTADANSIHSVNSPTMKLPDYIIGNPPFVGARMATAGQKQDLLHVFGPRWKNLGNMDYVCGWYKKAADLMRGTHTRAALVSTNSICQGEQVANLWQPLVDDGLVIDFARRTFRWDSEAKSKAHVHCVIIGFSMSAPIGVYSLGAGQAPPLRPEGEGRDSGQGALKKNVAVDGKGDGMADCSVNVDSSINAPASPPPPALRATSPRAGEELGTPSNLRGGVSQSNATTPVRQERSSFVMNKPEMKELRRSLRTNGTPAEGALWKLLKNKQLAGLQFRRQFSVGNHILDFYCPKLKLAIELDGDYHYHMDMPTNDLTRDQELWNCYGIKTLRFENKIVFNQPWIIADAILRVLNEDATLTASLGLGKLRPAPPLRPEGEDRDSGQGALKKTVAVDGKGDGVADCSVNVDSSINAPGLAATPSNLRGGVSQGNPSPSVSQGNASPGKTRKKESRSGAMIFDGERVIAARHINAYLIDGPDVFVGSRAKPLCDVPAMGIGNKPIDGGNYLFEREQMEDFIKQEPQSQQYFRPWYGAVEFIHRRPRYCLWLGECSPAQLRAMPHCLKRVQAVRELRLASKSEGTRRLADRPTRFHVENMPAGNYIIVPSVSSEKRQYIPMGFMTPDALASNLVLIIPDASLYHFGVLQSSVHMAWMRVVCGRLKSDYRYSKDVVYNNFPWPAVNEGQRAAIERTARAILEARALYPDSSLADLYDPVTMPPELLKAHRDNDCAVLAAYGLPPDMAEGDIAAHLLTLYSALAR